MRRPWTIHFGRRTWELLLLHFFFCRRRRTRAEHEVGIALFVNTLAGGETWSERCRSDWPGNKARNEIFDTFGFRWEGCGNQILPGPHSVVVSASANRRSTSDVGNLPATNRWTLPLWMNQQGRGCTPCAGRTIPRNTHHRIVPYYSQSINPMGESSKRRGTNRKNSCGIAPTADPVRGDVSSSVIAGRRTECLTTRRERDWRNTERTDGRTCVCVCVSAVHANGSAEAPNRFADRLRPARLLRARLQSPYFLFSTCYVRTRALQGWRTTDWHRDFSIMS